MDALETLRAKASATCPTILFPEGDDPKIAQAAERLARDGVCNPVVLGDPETVAGWGVDTDLVKVVAPASYDDRIDGYAEQLVDQLEMPARMIAKRMRKKVLWLAAALVKFGEVDAMVAGLVHSTSDVIFAGTMIIGLAEGIRIPSSYFLMDIPTWSGGEDGLMLFADCGVTVSPTYEELASIAESSADTAKLLLGWEPRVAMLSYSTKGSGKGPDAKKVVDAYELVRAERPDITIDGELQADAAIVPEVSERKVGEGNVLHGQANVLVFPDLDAGNIGYKLVQRMTGAKAYGPLLQGFKQPICDLSRGASVDDIYGTTVIVAAQVQTA